ncbi:MAG: crossover junction endodeoxyribonuclease RuvC [Chloroflexota bacterium]|nr:crossover junction endodeoxyribonuclease RuvC [Chloroflexota bacterium]
MFLRKSSKQPEVILGVDPGTTGMGYALLDHATDPPRILDCGIVKTLPGVTPAERLLAIATALEGIIAEHAPYALAVERLYFNKNVRTAMAVAEARGVALLCAARSGLTVAEYTPQEVKLSVTGTGGADKKQVQRMLTTLLSLANPITEDNVADAVAIALTHVRRAKWDRVVAAAT